MYLAEYLPRLDSVIVTVDNDSDGLDKVRIESGDILVGDYRIPTPIQGKQDPRLTKLINYKKTKETVSLTIKLPAGELSESFMNYSVPSLSSPASTFVQKWSVQDLKNKTTMDSEGRNQFSFKCHACQAVLVDSDLKFFDMPSELWSEMMEFWHCHKPNENMSDLKERLWYKGIVKPSSDKEVVIGSYYLLIRRGQVEYGTISIQDDGCVCNHCHANVGKYLEDISVFNREMYFRLNKWALDLQYGSIKELYQPYIYMYNMFMDKINSLAVRKFSINDKLFVWIINIGVNISCGGKTHFNTLKILYSELKGQENDMIEEFTVPTNIYDEFVNILNKIHNTLPDTNKIMTMKSDDISQVYRISYLPSN